MIDSSDQLQTLNPYVSRETIKQLEDYVDLVVKWNPVINLVSTGDLENIWDRHIEDSAQIVRLTDVGSSWVDLGSGGGFPGIVVAILLKTLSHSTKVVLVESDSRKAVFLRHVITPVSYTHLTLPTKA